MAKGTKTVNECKNPQFVDEHTVIPRLKTAIKLGHNVCLRGPTGTGKTMLIRQLAEEAGVKCTVLNMCVTTCADEIKGKWLLVPNEAGSALHAKWIDGALAKAMKEGHWFVAEEANYMQPEISSIFYSPLDNRRELILDEKDGEIIKAHPNFRLFFTANWDYQGTMRFNDAIANRVNSWFDMKYLSEPAEKELLMNRIGIKEGLAASMATFADRIRSNSGKLGLPDLSTRLMLNWAEIVKEGIDPVTAAEQTVVPVLAYGHEKQVVLDFLEGLFEPRKPEED